MKKPVYLDIRHWQLVDDLLAIAAVLCRADAETSRGVPKAALKWTAVEIEEIRAAVKKGAGIGQP